MSGATFGYMEKYPRDLIPDRSDESKRLEDSAKENKVPAIQKEGAEFLEFMVSMDKPKRILELGITIGHSSIPMNRACGGECHITTIERGDNMIDYVRENIKKFGSEEEINILRGGCLEVLEDLHDEFDMIFVDVGKGRYSYFLPERLKLSRKGGIIIADNVLFRGMAASNDLVKRRKVAAVKRMRKYLDMVPKDENLITTAIPIGDGAVLTERR